ncbi:DNA-directed RNA polymerase III subunit C31 [Martiniozyma asiatica (nom. inval.)]|nr:DNA-directed RNA polymerase III subunit C31 [Martiniozyma asiatica]
MSRRQLLPFGLEWGDMSSNVTPDFEYPLPLSGPLTNREKLRVDHFRGLVESFKSSSFYTGMLKPISESGGKILKRKSEYLEGGVNDGLQRFSDKYRKRIKLGKSISDHPFNTNFFPLELQTVITGKATYKLTQKNSDLERLDDLASKVLERIDAEANAEAALGVDPTVDAEAEIEEEEEDDEFDDEDDDDDYNAEKYFDDGDEFEEDNDDEAAF